jgi:hypothetical protein
MVRGNIYFHVSKFLQFVFSSSWELSSMLEVHPAAKSMEQLTGGIQVSPHDLNRFKYVGSFNNGFKGICSVFVTAAFSFAGTELAGLAAAETVFSLEI